MNVSKLTLQEESDAVLAKINAAIGRLGGAVSPKTNWSCPKDAVWVSTGSTHRCTNADEVAACFLADITYTRSV